jgi:intracellular sulfur oxidation DsrE/DsrF family protein
MSLPSRFALACAAGLGVLPLGFNVGYAEKTPPQQTRSSRPNTHQVVIQVTQNDPALMTMALNNAENLAKYYKDKGEKVEIEFVAYGAGLHIFREDTSPVKDRLATIAKGSKDIAFSACGNTLAGQSRMENKEIKLVAEARIVPTGIGRIVELEEKGWSYVRP